MFELGAARSMITTVEQRKLREAQQTERELAEKVSQATVEHLRHTFAKDMAVLAARVPGQTQVAREAALDKKYLSERQKSHGHIHSLFA
jgi:phenylpyruvate tautomerase PptA (4-oxalocrotonate tautomerase family)